MKEPQNRNYLMPERFCNSKLMQQKIMIMEPNKFDQSIKEKMEARAIVPSAEAWEKLEAMMPLVEKPKRKVAWLYIAASFTGLLIVGTIFFQNFETNIIQKDIL
jgi:hypothetical protein